MSKSHQVLEKKHFAAKTIYNDSTLQLAKTVRLDHVDKYEVPFEKQYFFEKQDRFRGGVASQQSLASRNKN